MCGLFLIFTSMTGTRKKWLIGIGIVLLVGGVIVGIIGYSLYNKIMAPNVKADKEASVFVYHGDNLDSIIARCARQNLLRSPENFRWWAQRQGLDKAWIRLVICFVISAGNQVMVPVVQAYYHFALSSRLVTNDQHVL